MGKQKKEKILVVDDDPKSVKLLSLHIVNQGYRVVSAPNGPEALQIVLEDNIDLILLDVMMPVISGFDITKRLKTAKNTKFIPVILVSALRDREARLQGIEAGCDDFLTKPIDMVELKLRIQSLLKVKAYHDHILGLDAFEQENDDEEKKQEPVNYEKLYADLGNAYIKSIRTFSGIIELKSSVIGSHSKRVGNAVEWLASRMIKDKQEQEDLNIAALLHDVGKIFIEKKLLYKINKKKEILSRVEKMQYQHHAILGESFTKGMHDGDCISLFIRHHHEHWDGTGFPDKKVKDEIPLGSRIIKVCDAYDRYIYSDEYFENPSENKVIKFIREKAGHEFDPSIVRRFLDYISKAETSMKANNEIGVDPSRLRVGMVLTRDLFTISGMLLLSKEKKITKSIIEKIENFQEIDPIIDDVFVYRKKI